MERWVYLCVSHIQCGECELGRFNFLSTLCHCTTEQWQRNFDSDWNRCTQRAVSAAILNLCQIWVFWSMFPREYLLCSWFMSHLWIVWTFNSLCAQSRRCAHVFDCKNYLFYWKGFRLLVAIYTFSQLNEWTSNILLTINSMIPSTHYVNDNRQFEWTYTIFVLLIWKYPFVMRVGPSSAYDLGNIRRIKMDEWWKWNWRKGWIFSLHIKC